MKAACQFDCGFVSCNLSCLLRLCLLRKEILPTLIQNLFSGMVVLRMHSIQLVTSAVERKEGSWQDEEHC